MLHRAWSILRSATEKLKANLVDTIIVAVVAGLSPWYLSADCYLAPLLSEIPQRWIFRTIAVLLIGLGTLVRLLARSQPRLTFDPRRKIYFDKKERFYCQPCFDLKRLRLRLGQDESGWTCAGCKEFFSNPDHHPLPPKDADYAKPWK